MTKLALFLVAAIAACTSKGSPPSAGDRAGDPVAASAGGSATKPDKPGSSDAIDTAAHNLTGLRPHQAANCPATLPGTTTQIAMTPRGVDVSITAKEPAVVHQIAALAEVHVRGRTAEAPHPHDKKHGGPGRVGYCPIVVTDQTTVTMTPIANGTMVHVEARSPSRVTELQEMIKERAVRLPGYLSS
jgi:hypothetical protein